MPEPATRRAANTAWPPTETSPLRSDWSRLALTLALLLPGGFAAADSTSEAALKAAYLYNFGLYTEWPKLPPVFEYCIAGKSPLGEATAGLTRKEIAGRPIQVRHLANGEVPASCSVLFVASTESARLARLLDAVAGRPVLTVADNGLPGDNGAMLQLDLDQGKISFTADASRARTQGLTLSSKMLRLARSVK
jgi:hypothetical protein